jgi:serine/threonine protein kinase
MSNQLRNENLRGAVTSHYGHNGGQAGPMMSMASYPASDDPKKLGALNTLADALQRAPLFSEHTCYERITVLKASFNGSVKLAGRGGFADVISVTADGVAFAVKCPRAGGDLPTFWLENMMCLAIEVAIPEKDRTGLVIPKTFYTAGTQICLVMPEGLGSLTKMTALGFRFPHKRKHVSDLVGALALLHDYGFAHLDIKPENILVETDPDPQSECGVRLLISDFGSATRNDGYAYALNTTTAEVRSPESNGRDDKEKGKFSDDVWALGCVVFYFVTKEDLFSPFSEIGVRLGKLDILALQVSCIHNPAKMQGMLDGCKNKKPNQFCNAVVDKCIRFDHGPNTRPIDAVELMAFIKETLADYPATDEYLSEPDGPPNFSQDPTGSPGYSPISPGYGPNSPYFNPISPYSNPISPQYNSRSPHYSPSLPHDSPSSPDFFLTGADHQVNPKDSIVAVTLDWRDYGIPTPALLVGNGQYITPITYGCFRWMNGPELNACARALAGPLMQDPVDISDTSLHAQELLAAIIERATLDYKLSDGTIEQWRDKIDAYVKGLMNLLLAQEREKLQSDAGWKVNGYSPDDFHPCGDDDFPSRRLDWESWQGSEWSERSEGSEGSEWSDMWGIQDLVDLGPCDGWESTLPGLLEVSFQMLNLDHVPAPKAEWEDPKCTNYGELMIYLACAVAYAGHREKTPVTPFDDAQQLGGYYSPDDEESEPNEDEPRLCGCKSKYVCSCFYFGQSVPAEAARNR